MEHSIPALDLARPWRTATLVASGVALLELVILLIVAVALIGKPVAEHARAAATADPLAPARTPARKPPPADKPDAKPTLGREETSVLVLNGNGRAGAAADAAASVHGAGYIVGGVGNAPRSTYGKTVVMYRPGYRAEAARFAQDLNLKVVGPVDGLRLEQLMGAHLALVLGR